MNTNKYELSVLINGQSGKKNVTKFSHEGKLFIEGKDGTEYILKVSNNTNKRVMAVVSLDGINVVDGKEATNDGAGYIVSPYNSVEIRGYRQDTTTVGAFKFSKKGNAYSKEVSGTPTNCGVIGCMIVSEKEDHIAKMSQLLNEALKKAPQHHHYHSWASPWVSPPLWCGTRLAQFTEPSYTTCTSGINLNSSVSNGQSSVNYVHTFTDKVDAGAAASFNAYTSRACVNETPDKPVVEPAFDLGSTWGQKLYDKVDMIEFERGAILDSQVIYYATREALEAMGVPLTAKKTVSFPDAFPGQFCTPPKNYS